jgi:dienelactone hydrolase
MIRSFAIASALCLSATVAGAQAPPRFLYPAPAADTFVATQDVQYGTSGETALKMDVFRPKSTAPAPALIFFNRAVGADRRHPFYLGWAQTTASKSVVAILPDLRPGSEAQDFTLLVPYLTQHANELGIDPNAIAVYAGSGNVSTAFPTVEDAKMSAIKAAVMYYGAAQVKEFRRDLPVLYVRAGLDRPEVNQAITAIASRAVSDNAPVTLLNHPTGYHAFEMRNDDEATRAIIDQTIAFVKQATAVAYQQALRSGLLEATAAGQVQAGNFAEAAKTYAALVTSRPDEPTLSLAYGEALLGDKQFAAACAEFEKLKGKGLGYRDLGLPAARACMQKGDTEAAIAWLRSIPQRFLPPSVAKEPVFASIQDRPDFQALFQPRER